MPKKNVLCLPREDKGVYGTERSKGAGNVVEDVDHTGAYAEEGSEGEDREVLGNEEKFFQEGLASQQVLWSSHKVVLRADLWITIYETSVTFASLSSLEPFQ